MAARFFSVEEVIQSVVYGDEESDLDDESEQDLSNKSGNDSDSDLNDDLSFTEADLPSESDESGKNTCFFALPFTL